jgi:hypothetical protein
MHLQIFGRCIQEYNEAFQANQGGAAEEERINEYMIKATKDHVELVDATGRCPIPPSQAICKKDVVKQGSPEEGSVASPTQGRTGSDNLDIAQEPSGLLAVVPEIQGSWGRREPLHLQRLPQSSKRKPRKQTQVPQLQPLSAHVAHCTAAAQSYNGTQ